MRQCDAKLWQCDVMRQCDAKLSPTLMRIFEEIEKEPTLDWSHVDIINYLNHEREILQRNFITQNNQIIIKYQSNIYE